MLFHVRAFMGRREIKIALNVCQERYWDADDGEWTSTYYTGCSNFAPIVERCRPRMFPYFEIRPVGSPRDDWRRVVVRWTAFGWKFVWA